MKPENAWSSLDSSVLHMIQVDAEEHPTWADMQNKWGLVLMLRGDYEAAVTVFEHCLKINPHYCWAATNRIQALALAGRLDDARTAVQSADFGEKAVPFFLGAFLALLGGQKADGLRELESLSGPFQTRLDVNRLRAALLWIASADDAKKFWDGFPITDTGLNPLTVAPWDEDHEVSTRWITFVPGLHQLFLEASVITGRLGKFDEAESLANLSFMFWSDEAMSLNQRGFLAAFRGSDGEAVRLYEKATRVAPEDARPHIALAYHWSAAGELGRAYQALSSALARAPRYADLNYQMALLNRAMEKIQEALESVQTALGINPNYIVARLHEARMLFQLGRWEEAKGSYTQVIDNGLVSSDILLHLGQIEDQLGDSSAAEHSYLKVLKQNPHEPLAHYLLGKVYQRQGDREKAQKSWREFLKLEGDPDQLAEIKAVLDQE